MSTRPVNDGPAPHVQKLQKELGDLKQTAIQANCVDNIATESAETTQTSTTPHFDQLTHTEKSAASLGVHPEAWKPIGFMNNAHFDTLMKSNALDENLARRIEAYRVVAGTD